MHHRIFIAINLPENIKNKLGEYQEGIEELFTPYRAEGSGTGPVRWTKKENLHITMMFLGYLSEEELLEVCKITNEIASRNSSFLINLKKIIYGPPKKIPPRMVWVEGEKSEELGKLQTDIEKNLLENFTPYHPAESGTGAGRPYAPHITLGRIKTWEFKQIEPEERPEVEEEINLSFEVKSIEVMESQLKREGSEYTILESASLADSKNF